MCTTRMWIIKIFGANHTWVMWCIQTLLTKKDYVLLTHTGAVCSEQQLFAFIDSLLCGGEEEICWTRVWANATQLDHEWYVSIICFAAWRAVPPEVVYSAARRLSLIYDVGAYFDVGTRWAKDGVARGVGVGDSIDGHWGIQLKGTKKEEWKAGYKMNSSILKGRLFINRREQLYNGGEVVDDEKMYTRFV